MNQDRRTFLITALGGTAALLAGCSASESDDEGTNMTLYAGTYTRGGSQGIYRLSMRADGALTVRNAFPAITNPSFLAIEPQNRFLYAVSETDQFDGGPGGSVASFAIDSATGDLSLLSQVRSGGATPAHISVDAQNRFVLVANYNGGNVSLLPASDGVLTDPVAIRQHSGSSVHPQRQQRPHAHSIYIDPTGQFALAADLGIDRVMVYRIAEAGTTLTAADPPSFELAPGSGPRHLVFHPDGRRVYIINELSSTITACNFDTDSGTLTEIGTVPTLPSSHTGPNTCAEVRIAPSGSFVYGSNRGHDSIAVFAVDAATGALTPIQHQGSGGRTPRNFEIDPSGRFLLAANQDSNNITVFRIDEESGELSTTEHQLTIPAPVCVRFQHV